MQDKDLKHRLQSLDVPLPDESVKKQSIDAAVQAFSVQHEKKTQGSTKIDRPIINPTNVWEHMIRSLSMKKAYIPAVSFAAVVAVLAVATTHYSVNKSPETTSAEPQRVVAQQEKPSDETIEIATATVDPVPAVAPPPPPPVDDKTAQKADGAIVAYQAPTAKPEPDSALVQSTIPSTEQKTEALQKEKRADAPLEIAEAAINTMPAPAPLPSAAPAVQYRMAKDASGGAGSVQGRGAASYAVPAMNPGISQRFDAGDQEQYPQAAVGTGNFEHFNDNALKIAKEEPVSTFSLDVDTASYSFVRRLINAGQLPPKDAVRIEEMINYFDYQYPLPGSKAEPFKPTVTLYPSPWNKDSKLLHIGIKGYDINTTQKPRSNLVFLIDVSGSMSGADRLPLVKTALHMLVDQLKPEDTVGIVTYANGTGIALEPTNISEKAKIIQAIDSLGAGGGTAGGEGIRQAYELAQAHFDKKAVNRVILSTDGDFNVGITDPNQLQDFITKKRESGIFLSILGVGTGNYNDALMQKLAQNGNGTASYISNLSEARKLLVEEASSTLFTIAKDVKLQVEFNPNMVSTYRLVGYESRQLKREDFNNDKVDAGDVGSGHAVTAIYEITPVGAKSQVDELRYGKKESPETNADESNREHGAEYAFLKIRYKLPDAQESKLMTTPITASQEIGDISKASDDVRFSTAVAGFGQLLRGDTHLAHYGYDDVVALADGARGKDAFGYRAEFVNLVRLAKTESEMGRSAPAD
ncbi:DUF3520 domain-containing protein [bacterium]|nr:DUF3520 domain-containing protein [bacterium]